MEHLEHHETQFKQLHVKVYVPNDENPMKKGELKTKIAQTRQGFHRDTARDTVV